MVTWLYDCKYAAIITHPYTHTYMSHCNYYFFNDFFYFFINKHKSHCLNLCVQSSVLMKLSLILSGMFMWFCSFVSRICLPLTARAVWQWMHPLTVTLSTLWHTDCMCKTQESLPLRRAMVSIYQAKWDVMNIFSDRIPLYVSGLSSAVVKVSRNSLVCSHFACRCIHGRVYVHAHTRAWTHTCMCMHTHTSMCAHMHTCVHMHVHTHARTHTYLCKGKDTNKCTCTSRVRTV